MKLIKLVKSLAAANNIPCEVREIFVENAYGVQIEFPWKNLPNEFFMEMLTPDGTTALATGLGLMSVVKPFESNL